MADRTIQVPITAEDILDYLLRAGSAETSEIVQWFELQTKKEKESCFRTLRILVHKGIVQVEYDTALGEEDQNIICLYFVK